MVTETDIRKTKILLIADDAPSIRMLETILNKAGYHNLQNLTQQLQLNQLQLLPGGPLEKISERFFLHSGVKPEFQFLLQVNTTIVN